MVSEFCAMWKYLFRFNPDDVIIVRMAAFFVPVSDTNVESLFRNDFSYDASIANSPSEYFISHTLMTLSDLSSRRSICAPGTDFLLFHEKTLHSMPDIPSACFIWLMWRIHTSSKERPRHALYPGVREYDNHDDTHKKSCFCTKSAKTMISQYYNVCNGYLRHMVGGNHVEAGFGDFSGIKHVLDRAAVRFFVYAEGDPPEQEFEFREFG